MQCRKCHTSFDIGTLDRQIYSQLKLPDPALCPMCRHQRRLVWRNDRTFYKAKSALNGASFISLYPADTPYTVYKQSEWYSDKWNAMDYGREFDFSRPFFQQFAELMKEVPRMNLDNLNNENSEYCNYCSDNKGCYLDIAGEGNEDSYYNLFVKYSKDTVDCTFAYHCQLCYESIFCHNGYGLMYCDYCESTADSAFCFDLKGCKNCLFSSNLRNKEYYIFNEPHTKEAYEQKVKELRLHTGSGLRTALAKWREWFPKHTIFRDSYQNNCEDCLGNNIQNSKNCQFCFNIVNCEDSKYLYDVLDARNCLDMNYSLYKPELSVDIISSLNMTHSAFCQAIHFCHQAFYSENHCNHCQNIFGCSGLQHKKYCILNKQYTKEAYEELLPKIIAHMQSTGEWGQFFPPELSPHTYNETVAQEYFPLTPEQAKNKGFRWRDQEGIAASAAILAWDRMPDDIQAVDSSICKETLSCEGSGKGYRLTEPELHFYKKMGLPIPRRSPQQRHKDRTARRTARRLWPHSCASCAKRIFTAFDPALEYATYCEQCYLKKVY